MRKVLSSVILSVSAVFTFAQQDPQFTQNMFMKLPVNPGYAGTSGSLCATVAYRTQWVGFPGAPKTFFFSADMPMIELHGGVGLTVMKDKLGNFNFTFARVAYSYHKPVGATGLLGIGLELGILQSAVAYKWLAPDGTDGNADMAIPDASVNKMTYDFGLGAYYRTDQLHVGLSMSHLPGKAEHLSAPEFNYQAARHYYVMAGYDFFLTSKITLRPSAHVKSDAAVTTFDLHCNLLYDNFIWGGLSYRLQDAIAPMIGVAWKPNDKQTIKIGYSYDLGTSDLKAHHSNTHEILVNYCIKWNRPPKIQSHINPRFLR
ncbi:MAG: type IX secretion system membrane protein PorP/SprF [Bacteroidetes bacterium]|nr:MAG: type IX secretion system membrane protein PorP/SprF [Bacteroidota bacterium]